MTTTPLLWLGRQIANTTDSGTGGNDQFNPRIAVRSDGYFVVMWYDNATSNSTVRLSGQLFDPLGAKVGDEFRINVGSTPVDQLDFDLAFTPRDTLVVVWERADAEGDVDISMGRFTFDASNTFVSGPISVVDTDFGGVSRISSPTLLINDDGILQILNIDDASVNFYYGNNDDASADYWGRRWTYVEIQGQGQVVWYDPFAIDFAGEVGDGIASVEAALLSNGKHVVVSEGSTFSGSNIDPGIISFEILDKTGPDPNQPPAEPFLIDVTNSGNLVDRDPTVAALTGGGFVIAWINDDGDSDLRFMRFNNSGVAQGLGQSVDNSGAADNKASPSIVGLLDGGFLLAWRDEAENRIEMQRFDSTGLAVGQVATVIADGSSFNSSFTKPELTLLKDGRVAVAYTQNFTVFPFGVNQSAAFSIVDPRDDAPNGTNASDSIIATPDGGAITIANGGGFDTVEGWTGNDTISGAGDVLPDVFRGRGGDDLFLLQSKTGAPDTVDGGDGFDTLRFTVATPGATVVANAGAGQLLVNSQLRVSFSAVEVVEVVGAAAFLVGDGQANSLTGGALADTLFGGASGDVLIGGAGGDAIMGENGNDTLIGGADGDPWLSGGAGADVIMGEGGNDLILGEGDSDPWLSGGAGSDTINGDDGDDLITGGLDNDPWLSGGAGADQVFGDEGDDTILGGQGADGNLNGGDGVDVVMGDEGNDTIYGGAGNDVWLSGGADRDVVNGDAGNDMVRGDDGDDFWLSGGADNDTVYGGQGADFLVGGAGIDVFLFLSPTEGGDSIADFVSGQDKLFIGVGGFGTLGGYVFNANPQPINFGPHLLYNTATGVMRYDADGLGAGGPIVLATFFGAPTVLYSDLILA